jgi:phage antirepressor YoqD-like protein
MTSFLSLDRLYTAKEISQQMGVPDRTVRRVIKEIFPDVTEVGKTTYLNERQVAQVSVEIKKSHNSNLASSDQVPITEIEENNKILDAISILQRRNKELEEKAAGYDKLIDTHNSVSIGEYAKTVGYGRNTMFRRLRSENILDDYNIPYQEYMHHFEVRQIESNGQMHPTTFIKASGMDFCNKRIGA